MWLRTHSCVCHTYLVILECSSPRVIPPVYLLLLDLVPHSRLGHLLEQRRLAIHSPAIIGTVCMLLCDWERLGRFVGLVICHLQLDSGEVGQNVHR